MCSIAERAAEHHQEPDHAEDQRGGEREDHEQQPGDEADHRPLDDARRVAVEGGVGDLLHQLGVGGREVLLDLPQDPLFVLGKRHRSLSVPGLPECTHRTPIHCRARPGVTQRVGAPRAFPRKATRRAVPDGTRTEPGPHLVDRPLQRRLAAARRRRSAGSSAPGLGAARSRGLEPGSCPNERRPWSAAARGARRTSCWHRDAEQADARRRRRARASSSPATRRDVGGEVGGLGQRPRAGDRAEVAEAHLELHRAARPTRGRRSRDATPSARPTTSVVEARRGRGGRSGTSPRGRSTSPPGRARPARSSRFQASAWRWRPAAPPSVGTSVVLGQRGELADGRHAERGEPRSRRGPDAPEPARPAAGGGTRARSRARPRAGRRAWRGRWRAWPAAWWSRRPTDAVSPVSARTRRADRDRDLGPGAVERGARRATSRNASSSEIGSTSGVNDAQDRHDLGC